MTGKQGVGMRGRASLSSFASALLLSLIVLAIPVPARALSFVSSDHTLTSFSTAAVGGDSASLPGTDLQSFADSVSTSESDGFTAFASNTTSLSYDVQPSEITASSLSNSHAEASDGASIGQSTLTIEFTVGSSTDYILDAVFQASGDTGAWDDFQADWSMQVRLEDSGGGVVFDEELLPYSPLPIQTFKEVDLSGTLASDTYTLFVSNRGTANGHDFQRFSVSLLAQTDVTLTLVPEPTTGCLLALAMLLALRRRRG